MKPSLGSHGTRLFLLFATLILMASCSKNATKPDAPPQADFYVNATTGLDANPGTSAQPCKTITHALAAAGVGHRIHLAPGLYDTTNGEIFPLLFKTGQALIGDTLNKGAGPSPTIVRGLGPIPGANPAWIDQFATIVAAPGVIICGLRLGAQNEPQHFLIDAHDAAVTIFDNTFDSPAYGGVLLAGTGAGRIRRNEFETESYGVYLQICTDSIAVEGNEFISPALPLNINEFMGSPTVIRGNYIAGSGQVGIQVLAGTPLIEENSFLKPGGYPVYGAIRCTFSTASPKIRRNQLQFCVLGVTVMDGAPDLGTAGDLGLNFFYVTGAAVKHEGSAAIQAIGNVWPHNPPTSGVDVIVSGAGSVRWGTGAGEVIP